MRPVWRPFTITNQRQASLERLQTTTGDNPVSCGVFIQVIRSRVAARQRKSCAPVTSRLKLHAASVRRIIRSLKATPVF